VIIDDLYIARNAIYPGEADAVSSVDPYAVQALAVAREAFKAIAKWHPEFINPSDRVEQRQLPPSHLAQDDRKDHARGSRVFAVENILRSAVLEVQAIITPSVISRNGL